MSMNLILYAEIEAQSKIGKHRITEKFNLQQTPTKITYETIESEKCYEIYIKYIKYNYKPYEQDVYADDDYFCEKGPVEKEIIDFASDHIKELDEWLENHKEWHIKWDVI